MGTFAGLVTLLHGHCVHEKRDVLGQDHPPPLVEHVLSCPWSILRQPRNPVSAEIKTAGWGSQGKKEHGQALHSAERKNEPPGQTRLHSLEGEGTAAKWAQAARGWGGASLEDKRCPTKRCSRCSAISPRPGSSEGQHWTPSDECPKECCRIR